MIDKDGKEECSFVDWDGVWWLKIDVVWFFLGDEEEEEEGERLTVSLSIFVFYWLLWYSERIHLL